MTESRWFQMFDRLLEIEGVLVASVNLKKVVIHFSIQSFQIKESSPILHLIHLYIFLFLFASSGKQKRVQAEINGVE